MNVTGFEISVCFALTWDIILDWRLLLDAQADDN